jgi:nicotinamidase-related amidase
LGAFVSLAAAEPLRLTVRRLVENQPDKWTAEESHAEWAPAGTAAVICDMWDNHWCKSAAARVTEMAPRMNELISALRKRGVLIIHCPSDTMKFYEGTPGRKLAQAAPKAVTKVPITHWAALDPKHEALLPIDDSDGGCDDEPPGKVSWLWTREIATLEIKDGDAITDNEEAFNLMQQRGITNVIVMGVHENMCILGRPFSIRQMVGEGQRVVLVRDMTDCLYNPRRLPHASHFKGTELMTAHIEKYWCGTITSDQVIGGRPFRFSADSRN